MDSPFKKRASEHLTKAEIFLPLVSPAPLEYILQSYKLSNLLDKLVFVLGTPGSGKTTFGRLFEFQNLYHLHENYTHPNLKALSKVLSDFGVLTDEGPSILAIRLAMDMEYREIWELPYDDSIKRGLFLKLIQSRCVLLWCNALANQNIDSNSVNIIVSQHSPSAVSSFGGSSISALKARAIEVESQVYKVIHSLVPKSIDQIQDAVNDPYDPLSHLIEFSVNYSGAFISTTLKPMLIVDDAHELHGDQFTQLSEFLLRRELHAARWVMTRYDAAVSTNEWIQDQSQSNKPGKQMGRDFIVLVTSQADQGTQKRSFRSAAQDIANRYLQDMPLFIRANQTRFNGMLMENCKAIPASDIQKLKSKIDSEVRTLNISQDRVDKLTTIVEEYSGVSNETEDVKLAMLRILLHRYSKRTPQQQLFSEAIDVEPSRELKADSGVMGGAKLYLMHEYNRPYYYGVEAVADSGNGNIEQFLRTADELVSELETKLIRKSQKLQLTAEDQHRLIRKIATKTIDEWDFPMNRQVHQMVNFIAKKAVKASLEPNAYLNHGASAFGVLRSDFEKMWASHRQLALMLQYGMAYNAISITPTYHCKNDIWTLIQLGGYPIIKYGLPFTRGGFVEGGMQSLYQAIEWD